VNLIDTPVEAPTVESPTGGMTGTAFDREELLQAEPPRGTRPFPPGRRHRVRRKNRQDKQLSSRGSVRRQVSPAVPGSDEVLLAGLRDGDVSAGDALIARYASPLLRYLQRLAGPELAEELHQQTWLSVLDHVGRFQSGGDGTVVGNGGGFKAWLFRIATNKANDVWRSRGREHNAKEALKRILDRSSPGAGASIETSEQNQKLAAALEMLPREQREALVLRFYSSMKFTEIARVVGCPVNTALTRVHKGILKLRQMMEVD
jgi:RNA polymerase sigma-70 factor (ECF subfamily)